MSAFLSFSGAHHALPEPLSLASLQSFVFSLTTIPPHSQSLFYLNKPLSPHNPTLPAALSLHSPSPFPKIITLAAPLRGGKGGFGSLLKSQRSNFVTTNFSAMRDLSGRRLRNVQLEAELSSFVPPDEQRMAEIRRDFNAINATGRVEQKRKCFFGDQCKYRRKCRYLHPDEEEANAEEGKGEREKAEKRARAEDNEFRKKMWRRKKELGGTLAKILAKKTKIAENEGKAVKNEGDGDKIDEKTLKIDENAQKPEKTAIKIDENAENHDENAQKIDKTVKITKENEQNAINLVSEYETPKHLETLGFDKLKQTLSSIGLKCGGTCAERAQRLFLIKHAPLSSLPKNVFAKN